MENAMAEGGDCVPVTLDYWQCRTTLMCGQFLVDGPGQCEESTGAAMTCTGWPG